jgi:hypothetical protein
MKRMPIVSIVLLWAATAAAQERVWWPGSQYDPAVPTPASLLGHAVGDGYTEHHEMLAYVRRLAEVSPRVRVFSVGRSYEGREIVLLAVSDPANIARLEEIRAAHLQLRDPRTTADAEARAIAGRTPAIAWMNFANDGNETAAFEAGIQLAYHLAAGTDDQVRRILKEAVTVIYPAHNPESHSRHVAWMKAVAMGDPDPAAREHRGDWLMDTNDNHYHIDLNRDAVFQSQVESQVIVREFHRWSPVLFVDHHGNPDRFFFPPWAKPVNVHLDAASRKWVQAYGKDIAAAFDRGGWTYYTSQTFDLHYPGYYDSYPTLNGATGMTFETDGGGNKGLAYRLADGRITTLADATLHHFTGAVATLSTTAANREARLLDFYRFRASALADVAREPVKQFVLVPGPDRARAARLVELLRRHQIEVFRAKGAFQSSAAHSLLDDAVSKRSFEAGAYVVPVGQPQKRLLRTLLDRETPLEESFVEQVQKARAYNDAAGESAPKKPYGFYDINAWSLPLAYGVEGYWTEEALPASALDAVTDAAPGRPASLPRPRFAYLFTWNTAESTRLVAALWKDGCRLSLAREPFTLEGRSFPAGVVVVRLQANPALDHARLAALAADAGVELVVAETGMVQSGRDLGDPTVVDLERPRIVVATEVPTDGNAYGATWYLFEKVYGVPFTAMRVQDLASADLRPFNVIVLPDGSPAGYARVLGEDGASRLRAWVQQGGTLVAVKGAAEWASAEKVALTTARDKFAEPAAPERPAADVKPDEKPRQEKPEPPKRMRPVPGAYVAVDVDVEHHLGIGMGPSVVALFESDRVFLPTKKGARVAAISKERPIVAGFTFDDARSHLAGAPFMWDEPTGRGHVTLLADDVTFRTFLHGAHRLLLNAVLLGPTFSTRVRME